MIDSRHVSKDDYPVKRQPDRVHLRTRHIIDTRGGQDFRPD